MLSSEEEDAEQYVAQRVEHQQGTDKSYGESSHHLAQRVVLQDDAGRTQYPCNQYKEA